MKKILISHGFQKYFPIELFKEKYEVIYFFDRRHPFKIRTAPSKKQLLVYNETPLLKDKEPAIPKAAYVKNNDGTIQQAFLTKELSLIQIKEIDYFLPFFFAKDYETQLSFLKFIESHGIQSIESSQAFSACMDKINSYNIFIQNNIPVPESFIVQNGEEQTYPPMSEMLLFYKKHNGHVFLKPAISTVGDGIKIPPNIKNFIEEVEILQNSNINFIIQKKVNTPKPLHHLRIAISYNKIIASQKFIASDTSKTSHVGRHKNVVSITLSDQQESICLSAAKTLGVNSCSLDCLISTDNEFFILEANILPAIKQVDPQQAQIMAQNMIEHIG